MANRVAWLTKRVKIGGQWFVRKPIVKPTGFVTEKVEHNGQTVHAPGTFVLEWYEAGKRQRKPLSESTSEAQGALRKKLQTLEARAHGLTVVEDKGAKGKVSLEAAVREYLEEVKLNRAHKTHLAYKRALGMLVSANPGCEFVQDLERRNLMVNFIRAMKEAGLGDRTQNNHRFRSNQARLALSLLAYNLGNLWRRLGLRRGIENWSLTSLQQRLVKT